MEKIIFENKWCKIVNIQTYYILKSKGGKYSDQYFLTSDQAFKAIGMIPPMNRYTFNRDYK